MGQMECEPGVYFKIGNSYRIFLSCHLSCLLEAGRQLTGEAAATAATTTSLQINISIKQDRHIINNITIHQQHNYAIILVFNYALHNNNVHHHAAAATATTSYNNNISIDMNIISTAILYNSITIHTITDNNISKNNSRNKNRNIQQYYATTSIQQLKYIKYVTILQ